MSGWLSRVRDLVGFNDPVDALEDYSDLDGHDAYQDLYGEGQQPSRRYSEGPVLTSHPEEETAADARDRSWAESKQWNSRERRTGSRERSLVHPGGSNVISMPTTNQITSEVMVVEPRSFDEMAQVVQSLRERKSVIMNLTLMEPADAQRSVDFVAGGTFAIDGHQERIGENIFLFTPSCVAVSTPSTRVIDTPLQPLQTPTPIWSAGYADAVGQV
ncbi:MAG: cell division protein SepF [Cyanophyceae cyanobacterium]